MDFPSLASDYVESEIDPNGWLVRNRLATYFVRVEGDSIAEAIRSGNSLVVDRSLDAGHGDVVVACVGGEMTVRWSTRSTASIVPRGGPLAVGNERVWEMKRGRLSGSYTTRLDEVMRVRTC